MFREPSKGDLKEFREKKMIIFEVNFKGKPQTQPQLPIFRFWVSSDRGVWVLDRKNPDFRVSKYRVSHIEMSAFKWF